MATYKKENMEIKTIDLSNSAVLKGIPKIQSRYSANTVPEYVQKKHINQDLIEIIDKWGPITLDNLTEMLGPDMEDYLPFSKADLRLHIFKDVKNKKISRRIEDQQVLYFIDKLEIGEELDFEV